MAEFGKLFCGVALSAFVAVTASNAALAQSNWTGPYIGVNGGYGWTSYNDQLRDYSNGAGGVFDGLSPKGFMGGGQIGLNQQFGPLVVGVEADLSAGSIRDSGTWGIAFTAVNRSRLDQLATARLRAGFTKDNVLLYATAGFALARIDNSSVFSNGVAYFTGTERQTGSVIGGGLEYKFRPQWSLKAEYLHLDFGKNDPARNGRALSSFPNTVVHNDEYNVVRIGLNYSFSFERPTAAPLK